MELVSERLKEAIAETQATHKRLNKTLDALGSRVVSSRKEILLDTLKLTDEVKHLNRDVEILEDNVADVDKRVVRLETMVEISKVQRLQDH